MVIRVYVSGISGNKEVKKRQQRVLMILESKNIPCEIIDITEPGKESDKEFMQQNSKARGDQKHPLPPQIFNDDEYCGDFLGFDLSNENEKLLPFLKMAVPEPSPPPEPKEEPEEEVPNEESELESEEEDEGNTKPSRPRPKRPTGKVTVEDDSNNKGDGNDDENANKNQKEESSENNEDEREGENVEEMVASEDEMGIQENEGNPDKTDETALPVSDESGNAEADIESEEGKAEEHQDDTEMEVLEE